MVVMDVFTRRIIGLASSALIATICQMFSQIIAGSPFLHRVPPAHCSASLVGSPTRLEIEIKSIPFVPVSHPFVERLVDDTTGVS